MFRYKSYKQTIAIAVIIILLCLTSIIGVTFALFINNVEDGTIGINVTVGKIKIDIVDEANSSLVGETLPFITPDPEGKIIFEPGATYRTQGFKIENEGDIPVNFHAYISDDAITKKEAFNEAFEFYITTDPDDRNADVLMRDFNASLDPKTTSGTYYLVIKMKEDANNDFANQTYGGIGITVYAVQGNVKSE